MKHEKLDSIQSGSTFKQNESEYKSDKKAFQLDAYRPLVATTRYQYRPWHTYPVADPGFPRGGGANSPGGRQHTIFPNFPKKCMKLKEFGPPGGCASKILLCRSATATPHLPAPVSLDPSKTTVVGGKNALRSSATTKSYTAFVSFVLRVIAP